MPGRVFTVKFQTKAIDNEDYLLMIAEHGTAYHMETLVRKYRRVTRLNEDDAEKQHDHRAFRISREDDGTVVLHARLPAASGGDRYQVMLHVSAKTLAEDEEPAFCRDNTSYIEGGFTCTNNAAGGGAFHDRNGRRMEPSGKLPAVRPSIDITEQMRDRYEDLFIDASTCVSHYSSGGINWDMTISGLMN